MSDLPNSAAQNDLNKKKIDPASAGQVASGGGVGVSKERGGVVGKQEVTPMTEYTRKVELEPEVEGWLERLEKEDTTLSKPVMDPSDKGKKVLKDTQDEKSKFKVILPMTKEEVEKGLHHKVMDGARWLAEWCTKMIKKFSGKVAYRGK